MILTAIALALASGCGYTGSAAPAAIGGSILGGHRPVSGATVELYAAGTGGVGSASQPLLRKAVLSDTNGSFTIPAQYGCPSPSAQIYIVARGGDPNVSGGQNSALMLTALLGPCSGLSKLGTVAVNEVTTVGSIWPLAKYWKSPTNLGSEANDSSFSNAVSAVPEFINLTQGSSPGTPTPASYFAENSKLYSLADALAACVNSSGGKAGDGSACGQLFSMAGTAGSTAPTDTLTAAIRIAQQPDSNVEGIFNLESGSTVFQPSLTATPPDWTLTLTYLVATPSISLATGSYTGTQEVTITDSTAGSVIYYTTDGSTPTTSSNLYSGPISISVSSTLKAMATLSGSASAVASSALTITGGLAPAKLAFLQQPSNELLGAIISPAVQVVVEDANGNPDASASNPITLALGGGTGLGGTLTVTPQNGVATFSDLMVSVAGAGYSLSATSPGLTSATSTAFSISASLPAPVLTPAKLVFMQQPSNGVTGTAITPAVQIAVEDANGNIVTTAITPVTVTLTSSKGIGGTLWTALPQNGIATFSSVTVGTAGTGYTLLATSPQVASATSAPFAISAPGGGTTASPFKLAFLQQPMNALTQATITPAVQVVVEDANGNAVPGANNPITLALSSGSGFNGTLTVTPQNGLASFNNLSVSDAGTYTLQAGSPGLVLATSASFTITQPSSSGNTAVQLAFIQQPSNAQTGATLSPAVQVAVQDSKGNVVTTAVSPITLSLAGGTGFGGTLTVSPQNGVATFSNLSVSAAGTGLTLTAASSSLQPATSTPFNISAPGGGTPPSQPVKLAFSQQPSNALTGATLTPAVQVVVEDANGNAVTTATNPISITLAGGTGLGGTLTVTPQNGVAAFSDLKVSNAGTGYTLSATSPNLTTATSNGFTITAPSLPTAVKLAFSVQPSNAQTGATITPAVQVVVEDSSGNTVSTATNPVTLALAGGTGLGGTLTATPQNGVATFSNLSVTNAGSYTLSASSPTLASAISTGFTITAPSLPTAVKLAFSVQPTNALTQATITPAVQVALEDASGNTVTSATNPVTVALVGGTGLSGTLTVTPQNGVATFSNLSVSTAGSYTLSASSSSLTSATSARFTISTQSSSGKTYYLSPSGSDSNSGVSASLPWLSPNHALNCGDVIVAAPGNYSASNFYTGKWGTVTCPAGNDVAWLQCATFDTCKISATNTQGMYLDTSYWGVQGWEVTTSSYVYGTCFNVQPKSGVVHHIIFANNVANSCQGGGFSASSRSSSSSADYIIFVGNIAYNTAHASGVCSSGFSIYQPIASDTAAGTHIYIAGNFAYDNHDANPCAGTEPTDGEGIIFDTFDFSQGGGPAYTQQVVAENNILVGNGGRGIEVFNNRQGSSQATFYIRSNTTYGNNSDSIQQYCQGDGEITVAQAYNVQVTNNLTQTSSATGCSGYPIFALSVSSGNSTDVVNNNFAYGLSGNNIFLYGSGSFAYGSGNITGTDPSFANAAMPPAPSCGGSANVPACMASMTANFKPTAVAAKSYGYQPPSGTNVPDPTFPQWLCTANLPAGLVTMGCE